MTLEHRQCWLCKKRSLVIADREELADLVCNDCFFYWALEDTVQHITGVIKGA